MTILCMVCKTRKPGPKPVVGCSRVVETRRKVCRVLGTGTRQRRSLTLVRLRECLKCRFRWKTYELPYPVKAARAAKQRMKRHAANR